MSTFSLGRGGGVTWTLAFQPLKKTYLFRMSFLTSGAKSWCASKGKLINNLFNTKKILSDLQLINLSIKNLQSFKNKNKKNYDLQLINLSLKSLQTSSNSWSFKIIIIAFFFNTFLIS